MIYKRPMVVEFNYGFFVNSVAELNRPMLPRLSLNSQTGLSGSSNEKRRRIVLAKRGMRVIDGGKPNINEPQPRAA